MNAASIAPLLTAIALAAVLVALIGLHGAAAAAPVAARLRTLYRLVAALLVCRLAALWLGDAAWLAIVPTMLLAAWLPHATLRLVEELCRRHAPRPVKFVTLGGALGFSVVAVTVGLLWSTTALVALAAFQAAAVAVMVVLLARARGGISPAERRTADVFMLALVATIPLALTDFQAVIADLPVRGGAFAVLTILLATSRLAEGGGSPRQLLADVALCLAGGGLVALAGAAVLATPSATIALAACGAAITALALLVERFARLRSGDGRLVEALARAPDGGVETLIGAHPLLASARIVDAATLADYPASSIAALARHRVIGDALDDTAARDAARDLLDATAATHLLRLSIAPPRFLAVSAGALAGTSIADELTIAAMLIERRA